MKYLTCLLLLVVLLTSCSEHNPAPVEGDNLTSFLTYDPVIRDDFNFYSETISDSFKIFVSLPKDYKKSENRYPVVYITDANVAFDMVSTLMKVITNGFDCRQAIYIGMGYKDIVIMDSLRFRDYPFPTEIEGYGAEVYSDFLNDELLPLINKKYRTQPNENILIGHSLGGYFVMQNLLLSALNNKLSFKGYVAGSAFIGNDSLFLEQEKRLFKQRDSLPVKIFMCSGTQDDTDSMQIVFADILKSRKYKGLEYESVILNDFDHMDALFPTWTKGLRYMLRND